VNEHDIVSRADSSYISSIIDLYRSRYGLPSVATDQPQDEKAVPDGPIWALPAPTFHLVGNIVVLRATITPPEVESDDTSDAPTISTTYNAIPVSSETFAQTLFCEVGVHKRRLYLERLRVITGAGKASSIFSRAETLVSRTGESVT
jgi:hypothetical protein